MRLQSDVERLASKQSKIVTIEPSPDLDPLSPAQVQPTSDGFIIRYSIDLKEPDRAEAIAHEYGHLLLHFRGLINVFDTWYGLNDYLALEMNNAISHRALIETLQTEYAIGSGHHLRCRKAGLDRLRDYADTPDIEQDILFGIGVALYDSATTGAISEKATAILNSNPDICRAFTAAHRYLSRITVALSREDQLRLVDMFLVELGF